MSSNTFTKENLDAYLAELGKEFRKLNGKNMPAEIILVGGAAVLANYSFREMTTDVDAVVRASSAMKDAIRQVGSKHKLPNGWLNDNFIRTESFSPQLILISKPYRTFSNVLKIRVVTDEYLVAMKLRAGRQYKHDLSDVVGILAEHEKQGNPIVIDDIKDAARKLYGAWEIIPEDSRLFIEDVFQKGNCAVLYDLICKEEERAKDLLVDFEEKYPKALNQANVNEILESLKEERRQIGGEAVVPHETTPPPTITENPSQKQQPFCKITFTNHNNGNTVDVHLNIMPENASKTQRNVILTQDETVQAFQKLKSMLKDENYLCYNVTSAEMVYPARQPRQKNRVFGKTTHSNNTPR